MNLPAAFMTNDFPVLAAGALASVACALVGCFLVLRRMSLMGDAISHAVVPGIVGAFLLSDSLEALPVFAGAAVVGVLTATLTELIHRLGRVEPGASMGVVFTVLFAVGVIMLERTGGRTIHLDPDCVLYGAMQGVLWPGAPTDLAGLFSFEAWQNFPRQVTTLAAVVLANALFVTLLFKELRITSFDPALAAAQRISPGLMHYLLMTFVATTTVAAFEAVGSILVVAMLIVPALAAHLLVDRLAAMLLLSAFLAAAAAAGGYATAAAAGVDTAGMIGVALGALLLLVGMLAPKNGWIGRALRLAALHLTILREDMLGLLYRLGEIAPGAAPPISPAQVRAAVGGGAPARVAFRGLLRRGEVALRSGAVALTERGSARAASLVRSHRLWESYLVEHLGLRPDHVHDTAMRLEHHTDAAMQERLARRVEGGTDPHGKRIP